MTAGGGGGFQTAGTGRHLNLFAREGVLEEKRKGGACRRERRSGVANTMTDSDLMTGLAIDRGDRAPTSILQVPAILGLEG